jgi:hypothetical protein
MALPAGKSGSGGAANGDVHALRKEGEAKLSLLEQLANVVQPAIMPAVERMLVPDALLRLGSKWGAEGGWDPTRE